MISVIIPVHNAGRWLERCLASLSAQTYTRWEAWLIDDGSTDGSAATCEAWAERDARLHVCHQAAQGPSAARNRGLALVRHELVTFVDADDELHPRCLEALRSMIDRGADVAAVGYGLMSGVSPWWECRAQGAEARRVEAAMTAFGASSGQRGPTMMPGDAPSADDSVSGASSYQDGVLRLTSVEALQRLFYQQGPDFSSAWGKMYRRAVAPSFPGHLRVYEDLHQTAHLLSGVRRVDVLPLPLYAYRKMSAGLHVEAMRTQDAFRSFDELEAWLTDAQPALLPALHSRRLSMCLNTLRLIVEAHRPAGTDDIWQQCRREVRRLRREVLADPHVRCKSKLGILLSYLLAF